MFGSYLILLIVTFLLVYLHDRYRGIQFSKGTDSINLLYKRLAIVAVVLLAFFFGGYGSVFNPLRDLMRIRQQTQREFSRVASALKEEPLREKTSSDKHRKPANKAYPSQDLKSISRQMQQNFSRAESALKEESLMVNSSPQYAEIEDGLYQFTPLLRTASAQSTFPLIRTVLLYRFGFNGVRVSMMDSKSYLINIRNAKEISKEDIFAYSPSAFGFDFGLAKIRKSSIRAEECFGQRQSCDVNSDCKMSGSISSTCIAGFCIPVDEKCGFIEESRQKCIESKGWYACDNYVDNLLGHNKWYENLEELGNLCRMGKYRVCTKIIKLLEGSGNQSHAVKWQERYCYLRFEDRAAYICS